MIFNDIAEITLEDLQHLIDNGIGESKTLEYKKELHIDTGDERKEFLADISAFANCDGGIIIYGIEEDIKTRLPSNICGIIINNEDTMILKIENLIRDSIKPRIPEIKYRVLQIISKKEYILIIQIKPSYIIPHRVIYKGHDKFYARNSKGKYPMDIEELRQLFTLSDTLYKKIDYYVLERIQIIGSNRYGVLPSDHPVFVMQAIPLQAFRSKDFMSITHIKDSITKSGDRAFRNGYDMQICIDGIALKPPQNSYGKQSSAIGHYYTNGVVEKATSKFFNPYFESSNVKPSVKLKMIYKQPLVKEIIKNVGGILLYYKELGVAPPIVLSCSIINGEGFTMPVDNWLDVEGEIDRSLLLVPNLLINEFETKIEEIIQPILDSIWNSCGFSKCQFYDDEGNFLL